ncbi:MAG: hypothetical protein ACOH5I_23440 [Oligoflexus sp.]
MKFFLFFSTLLSTLSLFTSQANAQSFGTKFACCHHESVSGLSSGSCSVITRTLKDRALTQVDAGARCLALGSRLEWATHECPVAKPCNGNQGPSVVLYRYSVRNLCNKEVKVLTHDKRVGDSKTKIRGYFFIKPGQTTTVTPNSVTPMIGYWAETVDGSYTWENGPLTPLGRERQVHRYAGRDHIMLYSPPVREIGKPDSVTINLRCN